MIRRKRREEEKAKTGKEDEMRLKWERKCMRRKEEKREKTHLGLLRQVDELLKVAFARSGGS